MQFGEEKPFLKLIAHVTYTLKDNITNESNNECGQAGSTGRGFVPRLHLPWSGDAAWTPKPDVRTCLAQDPRSGLTCTAALATPADQV